MVRFPLSRPIVLKPSDKWTISDEKPLLRGYYWQRMKTKSAHCIFVESHICHNFSNKMHALLLTLFSGVF